MREPISIDERRQAQEAEAEGKEWKPDPPSVAPKEGKEPKAEPKGPESREVPEHHPGKAAPGNMPWNRRS